MHPTRDTLQSAFELAVSYLEALDRQPVNSTVDLDVVRSRFGRELPDCGTPPAQVIAELARDVEGALLGSAGGRFFAWVVGGSLPSALAADWLSAAWEQNAGIYVAGPAAAVAEEVAGEWLKELLGIPARASFAFVTGCQMAHLTCLAAARHALLANRGWNVERQGLSGAPRIRIYTSSEGHGSVERAVRFLGLGLDSIISVPADAHGRVQPESLETALAAAPDAPSIVILLAGDLHLGAYDNFEALIPLARRHGAWVHVDGAFGLWAAASPRLRHLLRGAEAADSWATDGHKWLNVPYDCGYAFVADAGAHRAAMSHRESYLAVSDAARDQIDWNPEWSRRARGFPTYAAIRELGRSGLASLVERCCEHARTLVHRVGSLAGAESLAEPVINQGLVRFLDLKRGATELDHDRRTDEIIERVVASGEAYLGGSTWRGRRVMRISVCNWRTSAADVDRTVAAVQRALID